MERNIFGGKEKKKQRNSVLVLDLMYFSIGFFFSGLASNFPQLKSDSNILILKRKLF